jgi:putative ABC transport system substrate-binding protein
VRAQPKPSSVVGFVASTRGTSAVEQLTGIRQGLRQAGFVEGDNLVLHVRGAEGVYDRLPGLIAELLAQKVDVFITQAPPATRAAKAATTTTPIVFGVGIDPVADGLVASFARPGGNLTGVALLGSELMARRLDLMTELVPQGRLFALLVNPSVPNPWISEVDGVARTKGVRLTVLNAATAGEIDAAFAAMARERPDALLVGEDTFLAQRPEIAEQALRLRIPTIGIVRGFAALGGLTSYGASLTDAYRQIGLYAGMILKGARTSDLPVLRPTKFEFVLNLKTAKALGVTIPPLLLAQADEVIE